MKKFDYLEHTADIKLKIYGNSLNEIFQNSALAISDYLNRGKKIKNVLSKKIFLKGKDNEHLLYLFIDELIYLLDAEEFVVSRAIVNINDNELDAEILGDKAMNYPELDHIKAATYSEMHIEKKNEFWEAEFVVDI